MELLTGGELLDAVLEKGSYSEADARLCFIQLLRGVAYLHSQCASDSSLSKNPSDAARAPAPVLRPAAARLPTYTPSAHLQMTPAHLG